MMTNFKMVAGRLASSNCTRILCAQAALEIETALMTAYTEGHVDGRTRGLAEAGTIMRAETMPEEAA